MTRKQVIFIIVTALAGMIILLVLFHRGRKQLDGEPLRAIPINAGVIIQVNEAKGIFTALRNHTTLGTLAGLNVLAPVYAGMQFLDSLAAINPLAAKLIFGNKIFISGHATGRDKVGWVFYAALPTGVSQAQLNELLKGILPNLSTTTRRYDGFTIIEGSDSKNPLNTQLAYAAINRVLVLSPWPILLEDALRQYEADEGLTDDPAFRKVQATAGKNVPATIFVNLRQVTGLIGAVADQAKVKRDKNIDKLAKWAELDLNLSNNVLLLNGFISASDSIVQVLDLLRRQSPRGISVDQILPADISLLLACSLSDYSDFWKRLKEFRTETGQHTAWEEIISSYKKRYGLDIEALFTEIHEGELALALRESKVPTDKEAEKFILLRVKGASYAESKLREAVVKMAQKDGLSETSVSQTVSIDNETNFTIYQWPGKDITGALFGSVFSTGEGSFFTFFDNYLIFGNSIRALSGLLHDNILSRTLNTDPVYREYKSSHSPRTTVSLFADLGRVPMAMNGLLSASTIAEWGRNSEVFRKTRVFGLQITGGSAMLYTSLLMKFVEEIDDHPHTVWETLLDTAFAFKPHLVLNHNSKQTEIFLQDAGHNIYLINQAGRRLWKTHLKEPIISQVYQVDYFKNGKLQLLFSTGSHLHLIDRNGNYVERYPIRLRATATNGLALFDYDNNKDYRLFVACSDKRVYCYTLDGNLLPGWGFDKTEDLVHLPLNHFRIADRDYIVFGDRYKTYILDRRGRNRVEVSTIIEKSRNNNYHLDCRPNATDSRFVITDQAGAVHFIDQKGKVERFTIRPFSADHFFDMKDITGNGKKELIFLDEQSLYVFGMDSICLIEYTFDAEPTLPPAYYHFSATDRKLGVVIPSTRRIYLINSTGTLYKGFPLIGSTLFTIGYLGRDSKHFNLVVGGENNFLYNYAVH